MLGELNGLPKADRSAFLIRDGRIVAAWSLARELPDVDAIITATTAS